jgi:hypothetical protein
MPTSNHETRFLLTAQDKTKVAIKSAEAGFKGLDSIVSKMAVGFAGLAGAGGIGVLINSQIDAARQAKAYSDALGVNIADLTRWQAAAETVGIGADKMADIFKDTAEKIGDAYRNNGGEAKEALESLGLSVERIAQMAPDDQLMAIAGALQDVQTQGEKIQIMEALASDAALLLPLLDDNAAKLRELIDLADASGRTLNDIEADKLLQAGEAMRRLNMEAEGLAQTMAIELSDAISTVIRKIGTGLPRAIETSQNMIKGLWLAFADDDEINALLRAETIQEKNIQRALAMQTQAAEKYSRALIDLNGELAPHQELRLERIKQELEAWNKVVSLLQNPPQLSVTPGGDAGEGDSAGIPKISPDALSKMEETLTNSLLSRREIIMNAYLEEIEFIDMAEAQGLETKVGYDEMRMASHMKLNEAITAEDEKSARKRAQIEAGVQSTITGLKQQGLNQAIGILRQLGQEHDGAAYAAIALEKALAVAQINIEANKAHMAAYGLLQLGLAGPMAVSAMHTKIEASRSFALGMTAAAGLFEASQVGRGGSAGGGGAVPVTAVESPTNLAPVNSIAAPAQGNQITIVIKGEGPFDDMVRNSIEVLSHNDELVFING